MGHGNLVLVAAACRQNALGQRHTLRLASNSGMAALTEAVSTFSLWLNELNRSTSLRPIDRLQMQAAVIGRTGRPIANAKVAWATSRPEVAAVTEAGLVTPTGYGSTVVSASATAMGKATIVVMPAARSVVATPGSDTIFVEDPIAARDSVRLTATAFDEFGDVITGVAFSWSSPAAGTATVNARGSMLARGLGVVNITATSGTKSGTASVRVASAVKAIQVTSPVATVLAKDTVRLAATALGYDDKPMAGWTFTAKSAFTTSAVTVNVARQGLLPTATSPDRQNRSAAVHSPASARQRSTRARSLRRARRSVGAGSPTKVAPAPRIPRRWPMASRSARSPLANATPAPSAPTARRTAGVPTCTARLGMSSRPLSGPHPRKSPCRGSESATANVIGYLVGRAHQSHPA